MFQQHPGLKPPLRLTQALERLFTTEQFTYRQIWQMFIPMLLDQLFIFALSMLSMAMVSSSGEAALSAVTLVGPIGATISAVFSALGTGGTILVARVYGSGDQERVRVAIGQVLQLTVLMAAVVNLLFAVFAAPLMSLIYPGIDPEVHRQAVDYMVLMGFSYVPFGVFNAIFGAFRGLGDARSSLALTLIINIAHFLLSYLFINVLHLGVVGSGWAYIVARAIGGLAAGWWLYRLRDRLGVHIRYVFRFVKELQRQVVRLSMPIAAEQIIFQFSALVIQMIIARLPTSSTAAQGLATSAFNLYNVIGFTLTSITMTICGQCLGASRPDLASHYCYSILRAGRVLLLAAAVLLTPLMPLVLQMYHPSAETLPQALWALIIAAAAMPLFWCDASVPGAALRAAGDATYVTMTTLVAMWVARIGLGYVLAFPLGLGVIGFWVGLALEWALRALLLRPRLKSGRWLAKAQ